MDRRDFLKLALVTAANPLGCVTVPRVPLEGIIHREYGESEELAFQNNQYLLDNISPEQSQLIADQDRLKHYVAGELRKLEHIEYESDLEYSQVGALYKGHDTVHLMTPRQISRVFLLLERLKKKDFRRNVMKLIEVDIEDPQVKEGYFATEHGGLGVFNHQLELYPVPSKMAVKKREWVDRFGSNCALFAPNSNSTYSMIEGAEQTPHIFKYHFHATQEDNTRSSGPSFGLSHHFIHGVGGDIGHLIGDIYEHGEAHHLVFTKLKGRNFNVAYYGGELVDGKPDIFVQSLGNWAA